MSPQLDGQSLVAFRDEAVARHCLSCRWIMLASAVQYCKLANQSECRESQPHRVSVFPYRLAARVFDFCWNPWRWAVKPTKPNCFSIKNKVTTNTSRAWCTWLPLTFFPVWPLLVSTMIVSTMDLSNTRATVSASFLWTYNLAVAVWTS